MQTSNPTSSLAKSSTVGVRSSVPAGSRSSVPAVSRTSAADRPPRGSVTVDSANPDAKALSVIAEVLNVPVEAPWKVSDSLDALYVIQPDESADINKFGDIRGVVVDVSAGLLVGRSFTESVTITAERLEVEAGDEGPEIRLVDAAGFKYNFPLSRSRIQQGSDGVVMQAFLHGGEFYTASLRRLRPTNSRWGVSPSFSELYSQLGAPGRNELFHPDAQYSPWCYTFLLAHPSLCVGTRQNVGTGFVVFLGAHKMWDPKEDAPSFWRAVEGRDVAPEQAFTPRADFNTRPTAPAQVASPELFKSGSLSPDEANKFLAEGFFPGAVPSDLDKRQLPGEFVILQRFAPGDAQVAESVVRVVSPAYAWRSRLRDKNPNVVNQFYNLIPQAYLGDPAPVEALLKNFISLPLMSRDQFRRALAESGGLFLNQTVLGLPDLETLDSRLQLIWENYVFSLSPQQQELALPLLDDFLADRQTLIDWIVDVDRNNEDLSTLIEVPDRVKSIIEWARSSSVAQIQRTRQGRKAAMRETVAAKIADQITRAESGHSVYRMVVAMPKAQGRVEIRSPQVFTRPEELRGISLATQVARASAKAAAPKASRAKRQPPWSAPKAQAQ